jgi:hypothetical protein
MLSEKEVRKFQKSNDDFEKELNQEIDKMLKNFKSSLIEELNKDNPQESAIYLIFDTLNKDIQNTLVTNKDSLKDNVIDFFSLQMKALTLETFVENASFQNFAFVDAMINEMFISKMRSLDLQKVMFVSSYRTFKFQNLDKNEILKNLMQGQDGVFVSAYQKVVNSIRLEVTDKIYKTINSSLTECYKRTNVLMS